MFVLKRKGNKSKKNIILITLSIFLFLFLLIFYINYNIKSIKQDYNTKILDLDNNVSNNLMVLGTQITVLDSNVSSIDSNLQDFKEQNKQQIKTLSQLIDQIEQQSNIRLKELKDELKDVKIKSADFSSIIQDVLQSVVSVKTDKGQGSGVIIDSKGYIVTNVHVISDVSSVKVTTYAGNTYDADTLVGYDSNADIAVLKISALGLKALSFGDSDRVKVGEKVIAAGNPAGLAFTVTEGIVSAFRPGQNNLKYIQIDVPINPGNSGGPLINIKGEIVGINNFKVSGGFEGLGFAISSNEVNKVVSRIITNYESR